MFRAGISYDRFGKLTLKQIQIIAHAYSEKTKDEFEREDWMAFIQGRYVLDALLATVGNMFSKHSKFEYPKEPYTEANRPLSEEEIQAQRIEFWEGLQTLKRNFDLDKKYNKSDKSESK